MHAHRVKVLHVADRNARVLGVAHDLVLDLLPAQQRLLHQHLPDRTGSQAFLDHGLQLDRGARHSATCSPEGVGGSDHLRKAYVGRELLRLLNRHHRSTRGDRLSDAQEQLLECFTVLGGPDGIERCAQNAHRMAVEYAGISHPDGQVEPGLSAQGGEESVGPLTLDNGLERLQREWLDIDPVGHALVGHDGRRVRVDQDRAHALLAERLACLGAGVVELRRLPDHDRTRADNQHRPWHCRLLMTSQTRVWHVPRHPRGATPRRSGNARDRGSAGQQVQELVEDALVVLGTRCPFGVKLHRPHRQRAM